MSLSTLLEEIKKARPFAEENVEEGARETLNARRGRKAQNIELMKRLKSQYASELRSTAAFVLVVGSKRKEFTEAAEGFKCFVADPEYFYSDLAKRVPTSLYLGKEGMSNIFDILGRHLEDKAHELDIVGYPQLIFRQEYRSHISNQEEFLALVKRAINEQVGGEVVGIQSIKNLTDVAIDKNHAAKVTPILLPTGDELFALTVAEALEKISTRVFIVAAGETKETYTEGVLVVKEPTSDSVKKTLKTISNSLKK